MVRFYNRKDKNYKKKENNREEKSRAEMSTDEPHYAIVIETDTLNAWKPPK